MAPKSRSQKSYQTYDPKRDRLNFNSSYNLEEQKEIRQKLEREKRVSVDDLRRISLWKLDRILSVSEETLSDLNELKSRETPELEDDLVKKVLEGLTKSKGIGFPMASAILKFINPRIFPIIDVRAYRALYGKKPTYTYDVYIAYSKKLTEIAHCLGKELDEIDEQLYCFDKERNGKIGA